MLTQFRWRFLAYRFFSDLTPVATIYVLLFQEQGITNAGISGLLMLLSLAVLLFEIPTGSLADRMDRRKVLWYSRLLKGACFFLWLFFPTFIGFGVGLFLWGIGTAMVLCYLTAFFERTVKPSFKKLFLQTGREVLLPQ